MSAACCGRRPLRQAFRDHHAGKLDDARFAEIQDQCIRDVVRMQEEVGLQVVTDGEFRRGSYWGRFVERVEGFAIKPAVFNFRDDHGHEVAFTAPYAERKLQRKQPLALDEFDVPARRHQGDAEDHAAGAVHDAFLPLHRFRRAATPTRTSRRSSPI